MAEYNFWADPMAAHEVLMSGIQDVTMIGLDVTNKIALDGSMREILRMLNTKLSTFVYNITGQLYCVRRNQYSHGKIICGITNQRKRAGIYIGENVWEGEWRR